MLILNFPTFVGFCSNKEELRAPMTLKTFPIPLVEGRDVQGNSLSDRKGCSRVGPSRQTLLLRCLMTRNPLGDCECTVKGLCSDCYHLVARDTGMV